MVAFAVVLARGVREGKEGEERAASSSGIVGGLGGGEAERRREEEGRTGSFNVAVTP